MEEWFEDFKHLYQLDMPKYLDIKFNEKLMKTQKIEIIAGAKMNAGDLHLLELLQKKYKNITTEATKSSIPIS